MSMVPGKQSALDLDRERVTCLLLINAQLMKKAVNIYMNILTNQQTMQQIPPQNKQTIMDLYQNCTRRIHCNLSVLSYLHEKYHADPKTAQASKTQFPIIMSAPQDMPELGQLYGKLQELYPEALEFLKGKINQMRKQAQVPPSQQSPLQATPQLLNNSQMPRRVQQSPAMANGSMLNNIASNNYQNIGPKDMSQNFMQQPQQAQQIPQQQMSQFNAQSANSNFANMSVNPQLQPQQLQQLQQPQQQQQQPQQQQPQQPNMQSISPQQIIQQMNNNAPSNNSQALNNNTGLDFF